MRRLPRQLIFSIAFLASVSLSQAQHPHGADFTLDCKVCHNPSGWTVDWTQASFDHSTTGFPLDGQHAATTCVDCHAEQVFTDTPTDCASCHDDVHQMTVGSDCVRCHDTETWLVMDVLGMHEVNGFVLEGGHATAACIDCHTEGNPLAWERLSTDCIDCHQADYLATVDPDHVAAGYSTDCASCHDAYAYNWGSEFFHGFFPLEGGHMGPTCADCHHDEPFEAASPDCVSCHLEDFMAAADPDHVAAGFPEDCTECHNTFSIGWTSTFDHGFFPLEGGHMGPTCTDCHHNEPFEAASPECVSCHLEDFTSATQPDHVASGFPQDCAACHTTAPGWNATAFLQHDDLYFPIYSGEHEGEWNSCTECHTTPGDYSMFSCIDCHEHDDPADLADEHDDVGGYVYDSQACYECHPNGDE